ncbi:hypothetical protein [Streptomyces pristinaespiralis]|uniref:hypothetical protein n=1 Tax=Streptomyces pristinaespiralis TaxID=38300 RepID=UPI0033D21D18
MNPVHSRPSGPPMPGRSRGHRTAHTRPDHVRNWFVRRLQPAGEPRKGPDGGLRDSGPGLASVDPSLRGVGPHRGAPCSRRGGMLP